MSNPGTVTSIGDGDDRIILKALLYAIANIQTLPDHRQERIDMNDMCALARASLGSHPASGANVLWGVEHHVGHEINLWPAHGGEEANGLYSDEELDRRDSVRAQVNEWKARFEDTGSLLDAPPSNAVRFIQGGEAV